MSRFTLKGVLAILASLFLVVVGFAPAATASSTPNTSDFEFTYYEAPDCFSVALVVQGVYSGDGEVAMKLVRDDGTIEDEITTPRSQFTIISDDFAYGDTRSFTLLASFTGSDESVELATYPGINRPERSECPGYDDDNDGITDFDDADKCLGTPAGESADANGCSASQRDTDGDGSKDDVDECVNEAGPGDNAGCPVIEEPDPTPASPTTRVSVDGSNVTVTVNNTDDETNETVAYEITINGTTATTDSIQDGSSGTVTLVINQPGTYTGTVTGSDGTEASFEVTVPEPDDGGNNPPGNNGTLKVHEEGTPSGTESNDPKVCVTNFEGFGFDDGQSGVIKIVGQGQTPGDVVATIPFGPADENGFYATAYFNDEDGPNVPNGHYKATLYDEDGNEKAKSKVFKVECDEVTPPPHDECPDIPGNQEPGTDCNPQPPVECPVDTIHEDTNGNGTVDEGECQPVQPEEEFSYGALPPDCDYGTTLVFGEYLGNNELAVALKGKNADGIFVAEDSVENPIDGFLLESDELNPGESREYQFGYSYLDDTAEFVVVAEFSATRPEIDECVYEPPLEVCPEGFTWFDRNEDGYVDKGECYKPDVTPPNNPNTPNKPDVTPPTTDGKTPVIKVVHPVVPKGGVVSERVGPRVETDDAPVSFFDGKTALALLVGSLLLAVAYGRRFASSGAKHRI